MPDNLTTMRSEAKPPTDGSWAYLSGWASEANPHPPGSDAAAKWADDWTFQERQAFCLAHGRYPEQPT